MAASQRKIAASAKVSTARGGRLKSPLRKNSFLRAESERAQMKLATNPATAVGLTKGQLRLAARRLKLVGADRLSRSELIQKLHEAWQAKLEELEAVQESSEHQAEREQQTSDY